MDYGRDSGGNAGYGDMTPENWIPNPNDSSVWATEEDYRVWTNAEALMETPSNSSYDNNNNNNNNSNRHSQSGSGGEPPPNKKTRNSQEQTSSSSSNNRAKAIGKMFFKTKLCCKFRAGTCPYVTNCNFAHSIEELRRPPPNWQDIVASHAEEKASVGFSDEPREEFQIPTLGSSAFVGEMGRSYKGRHCKKFYTEEGCPYGENCTFLHDEQSKNRESVAISLGPGGYGGGGGSDTTTTTTTTAGVVVVSGGGSSSGGGGDGGNGSVVVVAAGAGAIGVGGGQNLKPSNWKTRICNKWELTGYCPFGNKCHFAHGAAELHRYGGGLVDLDGKDSSTTPSELKQGVTSKTPTDSMAASAASVPHTDYHMGPSSQRSTMVTQKPGQRAHQKWKGPDKISRIYGDWIDDIE